MDSFSDEVESLFAQYSDEVYRYVLFVLGNPADAQDAVQEVFLRVFRSWGQFHHNSSPRTYIWSVTRNYLTDLRRKRILKTVSLDIDKVSLQSVPTVAMNQIVEWEDLLRGLRPHERQVVYWRIIQDLPVSETADVLDWSPVRVRVTLHRALRRLREMAADARGEQHGF